jgi:arginase
MNLHLLSVPYDTARRGERMGAGPEHLLRSGADERLRSRGHDVRVERVEPPGDTFPAEISTAFALQRAVAAGVRRAVSDGSLPIVLSGNCNAAAVGVIGGLGAREIGVLWFDSHGDFNTPETTVGGFLDGMALAIVTGRCWRQLVARLPGFEPVDAANVILIGARDLDPLEAALIAESPMTVLRPAEVRTRLDAALDDLRGRVRDVYVHVDLDVLDPVTEGRANTFAAPDGLALGEVISVVHRAARHFRIRGAALTAYDPSCDDDGRVCGAAATLLATLADAAASTETLCGHSRRRSPRR